MSFFFFFLQGLTFGDMPTSSILYSSVCFEVLRDGYPSVSVTHIFISATFIFFRAPEK